MKLISWNVNGLRAVYKKDFSIIFMPQMPIFSASRNPSCRKDRSHLICRLPQYWNYAEKKGYSGTAIFAKHEPLQVTRGIGTAICDTEGRVITLEYDSFYLVTCYTPTPRTNWRGFPTAWNGRCFPRLSSSARQQKAGHSLRRFKCCTQRRSI